MDRVHLPNIILGRPYQRSIDHLFDELARVDLLVRAQVALWRLSAACAGPQETWGMVVISESEVERYLESEFEIPGWPSGQPSEGVQPWWKLAARLREDIDRLCDASIGCELRLKKLAKLFELNSIETDVLLLCLLVDIDERYGRLAGYMQNDASRQFLTIDLISQILRSVVPHTDTARDLFGPSDPLLANHLVITGETSGHESLPLRSVRIDDRVAVYLLGSDKLDSKLSRVVATGETPNDSSIQVRPETHSYLALLPDSLRVCLSEQEHSTRVLLLGPDSRLNAKVARSIVRSLEIPLLEFDVQAALRVDVRWEELITRAYREAQLRGAALLFISGESVVGDEQDRSRWHFLEGAAAQFQGLTIVTLDSTTSVSGAINDGQFWTVDLPLPDFETRRQIWLRNLSALEELSIAEKERDRLACDLASAFQTTSSNIEDAIKGARNLARRERPFVTEVTAAHLYEACRRQAGKRLVTFAQRIEPHRNLSIDDVVLPEANKRQLIDLSNRIRFHRELLHRTSLDQTMRLGKGLLALFAGSSGTGKTMAAEALANGQGVDLYKVDLSAVVSKWVGETEKNLSRIFLEAETSNGWLFFDEGESLFGSRGEIKQAQDRLLNLEVNYLLQRIEEFSGVVILATNLRQNIDEAFLRRIHALVEFPQPNAQSRAAIWKNLTPSGFDRDFDDAELQRFAGRFELSGGSIRNVVLDGMFRAYASTGKTLTLRHFVAGLGREYQKLGRPITSGEFGDVFYKWVVEDVLNPLPGEGGAPN